MTTREVKIKYVKKAHMWVKTIITFGPKGEKIYERIWSVEKPDKTQ